MLKVLFLLSFIVQVCFAQKLSLDERRKKILGIVEEELSEVSRLAKQQDYRSPDTLLQVSELNLEKARLWREVENEQFLAISPEDRRGLNKSEYFKNSTKYFLAANDSAKVVVSKFPGYKLIADVYYIIAFNSKELRRDKDAKKYLKLAIDKAPAHTKIGSKARLALADYYYNDHKYGKAIPLYESSINKVNEKWWTKDAFNLAWSYYRVRKYDRAISLMKEVHRKSSNSEYIDMRSMVERDLGIFFVDAGKLNDAIKFYEGLGLNYTDQFVKIAGTITIQGKFAQADSLLSYAAKHEKSREKRIEILLAQLNLFDKYADVSSHLSASKELVSLHEKSPLMTEKLKSLQYQVNKKAAELQKSASSVTYTNVPKVKKKKANQAMAYFELSATLSPELKAEKKFYQGESAYVSNQFSKAIRFYIASFDIAKSKNEKKLMMQSLEGMLSSLGHKSMSKNNAEKYFAPVYTRYLSVDSTSQKANSVFVKLFNTQYGAGDVLEAEKTLEAFSKSFPTDFKTQEGMLAKIMEYYRKRKDYSTVKAYVSKINDGSFKVSKKYADALRNLMTKIQIEGVQQSLEKGDKAQALKGYHQIVESPESTPKAKVNAAYNLSALYYELGNSKESYSWAVKALKDMSVEDVNKLTDSLLSISAGLFLKQEFSSSVDLSYRLLEKLCKKNSSNKVIAYKNAVFISLSDGDINKALEIRNQGKECLISDSIITEVSLEVLKELSTEKRWEQHEKMLAELEKNSKNFPLLIRPYEDLRLEYVKMSDFVKVREIENKQLRFYNQAKAQKLDIPVEGLDLIAEKMLVKVVEDKNRFEKIKLQFPEVSFNNAVKTKLKLLDQLTSTVNDIQKIGSGKGIVEAYKYVISLYEDFGNSVKNFVPEGKSPEYVTSFQKAMSEVYRPILANAKKLREEIKKLVNSNKILSHSNYDVLFPHGEEQKRFISLRSSVLMERGGKK